MLKNLWADRQRTGDAAWIALLILVAVGGLSFAFATPNLCGLLMAGVLGLALWRWHQPLDLLLVASGLLLGPTLELAATSAGLWRYPFPSVGALPSWVFALWPVFPLCLVRLTHALLPPAESTPRPLTELATGLGIVALEIPLLCTLGTDHPALATAGTVLLLVPAFSVLRSPQAMMMLFISGVVGPLCESVPVQLGAWSYPNPAALGMPLWLPTGYAVFGFALVRVALGLEILLHGAGRRHHALPGSP